MLSLAVYRMSYFCIALFLQFNIWFVTLALEDTREDNQDNQVLAIINKVWVVSYNTAQQKPLEQLPMTLSMFSTVQSLKEKFQAIGPICIDLKSAGPNLKASEIEHLLPLKEYIWAITSSDNTDGYLKAFGRFDQLRWLDLWRNQSVTDQGVSKLLSLRKLVHLNISCANLTLDSGILPLSQLPALSVLDVSDIHFPKGTNLDLSNFKSLASIDVSGSGINPSNIINPQNISLIMKY